MPTRPRRSKGGLFRIVTALVVVASSGPTRVARADDPPTPEESFAALKLADPTLVVELVASEPAIADPVAIAWDERGGLFVVEMTDYPAAAPNGRIRRLEDRDGDGRNEHAATFAEGLPYPSGVLPWNGGVLVTAAPDLLFLKDSDGDGRADVREVILTGFFEGNQQLRVNSPTWGLDNWVYLANGRSGGAVRRPGDPAEKAVPIPRSDLRVRPSTGEFEPVAGFSQFGLPRDDWGDRFPSWNTVPIRHVVLEDRVLARNPALAGSRTVADILDLTDGGRIYSLAPAQARFNAETVAYFNATCGPTIYRGDLLGQDHAGHAFVCEPLTSVVHHRRLDPDGPTFAARRVEEGREFLASTHPWFRPVNLATGPDGALYVVDFCRAWVEHPAFVPEGQRDSVDFREGHDKGRIWRIARREGGAQPRSSRLADATVDDLVASLAHPNGWQRDTAQRLLVERREFGAAPTLRELARSSPNRLGRVHALWTLDGLGVLDTATLRASLGDPDPRVREQAARLAESRAGDCLEELLPLAEDSDPRVRLRAAIALATVGDGPAREALARVAARDADSPWTATAILGGLGADPLPFLEILSAGQNAWLSEPSADQARFLENLAVAVGIRGEAAEIAALFARIRDTPGEGAAFALLHGLAGGQARVSKKFLDGTEGAGARESLKPTLLAASETLISRDRPDWLRVLALGVLLDVRDPRAGAAVAELLDPSQPTSVQAAAAGAVARLDDPRLASDLLQGWDRYALVSRRALLGSLSSSPRLAATLIEAVESGTVAAAELDPATREALRRIEDPAVKGRFEALLRDQPDADRTAVVRSYEAALTLPADADRGRAVFERQCLTCHARNGRGARVGPDLISVVGRPKENLLVAILDPSREVGPESLGVVVATTQGQTFTGILVEESPAAIRLRKAEGLEDVIPRGEVEALRPTGRSFMPEGLEQVVGPQEMADLIDYLRRAEPGSPPSEGPAREAP